MKKFIKSITLLNVLAFLTSFAMLGMIVSTIIFSAKNVYNPSYPIIYFMVSVWVFGFLLIICSILQKKNKKQKQNLILLFYPPFFNPQ